tara:strand:- start:87 stop:929 length:843 start_codon:yes stop_codon:yes gene_type:complete
MKIIDSHQHFWNPSRGDYFWMAKDNKTLFRKYGVNDLLKESKNTELFKTVLVQAAPSNQETEYMLGIADSTDLVAGVVGWIDFEDISQIKQLRIFSEHPKLISIRPMIQDIKDVDWMLNKDFNQMFNSLIDLDICFDALGFPVHLDNFYKIAKTYNNLKIVIDHLMKPKICKNDNEEFNDWKNKISKLSKLENVYCKFSGMVTEACDNWNEEDLIPYYEVVLNAFTDKKLMWGSDWPVCKLRTDYKSWLNSSKNLTKDLSLKEKENIFYNNAIKFYNLKL